MELLVVIILVLAVFALIAAIWGRKTAQGCFANAVGCAITLVIILIIGGVLLWRSIPDSPPGMPGNQQGLSPPALDPAEEGQGVARQSVQYTWKATGDRNYPYQLYADGIPTTVFSDANGNEVTRSGLNQSQQQEEYPPYFDFEGTRYYRIGNTSLYEGGKTKPGGSHIWDWDRNEWIK